jgi:hypothetical protein
MSLSAIVTAIKAAQVGAKVLSFGASAWAFIVADWWRAVAMFALVIITIGHVQRCGLRAELRETRAELTAAHATIDTAQANARKAAADAGAWQTTAMQLRDRLETMVEAQRLQTERDAEAVRRAQAARADADRTLRAWLDRYADATRAAECAAIERMRVCEVTP